VAIPPANFNGGGASIANQDWFKGEGLLEKYPSQSELEVPYLPTKENLLSFLKTHKQDDLYKLITYLTKEDPFIIAPYFNRKDQYSREAYTLALANIAAAASQAITNRNTLILSLFPISEPKTLENILQGHHPDKYAAEAVQDIHNNLNPAIHIQIFTLEEFLSHTPQPNELAIISLPFLPSSMFKIIAALSHLLIAEGANNVALRNALSVPLLHFEYHESIQYFLNTFSLDNISQHIKQASQFKQTFLMRWDSVLTTADELQDKDKISQVLRMLETRDFPISQCHAIELKDINPGWRFLPNSLRTRLRVEEYNHYPSLSDIDCRISEFKSALIKLEPSEKKHQQQLLLALAEGNKDLASAILQQSPRLAIELAQQNLSIVTPPDSSTTADITDLVGIVIANQDDELLHLLHEYGVGINITHHRYFAMFTSYQFYQTWVNDEHRLPPAELAQISIQAENYRFTRELISYYDKSEVCSILQNAFASLTDADLAFALKMDFNCQFPVSRFHYFISSNARAAALYKLAVEEYNMKYNEYHPGITTCNRLNVATRLSVISGEQAQTEFLNEVTQNCKLNPSTLIKSAQCIAHITTGPNMAQDLESCLQSKENNFLICPETGYVVQNTAVTQNTFQAESANNPSVCEQLSPSQLFCKQIIPNSVSKETKCEVISNELFTETRCIENIHGETHLSAMYHNEQTDHDSAWPAPIIPQQQTNYLSLLANGAISSATMGFCQTTTGKLVEKGLHAAGASPSTSFFGRKAASATFGVLVQVAVAGWGISHLLPSMIKTAAGEISAKACELAGLKTASNLARVAVPLLFDIATDPTSAVVNVISASVGAGLAEATINRLLP
jgi:hypothetical protein